MRLLVVLAVAALAGCGADGDPIRPEAPDTAGQSAINLSVSGTAEIGITR